LVKNGDKDQQPDLSSQIQVLSDKIDAVDAKLTKVEQCSNTTMTNTQTLVNNTDMQHANLVVTNNISDPNGFIAREITNQLIVMLQKYQNTDFRRWLAARGRNVVEISIANFVSQQLPQLKWYGVQLSKIDESTYHQTAKTSFPVQLKTGIPIISTITLAKVNFEFEGDVDVKSSKLSNTKSTISTGEEEKQVFKSFVEDLDGSLKPHKRTYAVLHPIGSGVNRVYKVLLKETNFSIPFALLLLATIFAPQIWPAAIIYFGLLRLYPIWFWFLGISLQSLVFGLINGAIYGSIVWLAIRYKILERMKVFGFLTKINKPGGPQIDLRVAAGIGVVCIVLIAGVWWVTLPKAGGVDVAAVRAYSDPDSTAMLKALDTAGYSSISGILDGSVKTVLTEPGFAGYSLYVKRALGAFNSTVFWKASDANGVSTAVYNATYSGVTGSFPIEFAFVNNGGYHYLSGVDFQDPAWRFKIP
jgi:hypothetical protein